MDNLDVFALASSDMPDNHPSVASHKLNVDKIHKPVKQEKEEHWSEEAKGYRRRDCSLPMSQLI